MSNRASVVVITTGGKRFDGYVYANDKQAAEVFARSWATLNGYKVGFVNVYLNGEMKLVAK